jgi:hypothetical protein
MDGLSKGYLIRGKIDELMEVKLYLNNTVRYKYNKVQLGLYGERIGDELLFIPFKTGQKYCQKMTMEDWRYGLNQSRIDCITMELKFSQNQTDFSIYSQNLNFLKYMSGMSGIMFEGFTSISNELYAGPSVIPTPPPTFTPSILTYAPTLAAVRWERKKRLLDMEKNSVCPILITEFEIGCEYVMCGVCKYNFSKEGIDGCISNNMRSSGLNCPLCRSKWENWNIYENVETISESDVVD